MPTSVKPYRGPVADMVNAFLSSRKFEFFITALIIFNAITLGLETSKSLMATHGGLLHFIDRLVLYIFVAELVAKLFVFRQRFFTDPWNIFDFIIVGIALVPSSCGWCLHRSTAGHGVNLPAYGVGVLRLLCDGDETIFRNFPTMVRHLGRIGLFAVPNHDA